MIILRGLLTIGLQRAPRLLSLCLPLLLVLVAASARAQVAEDGAARVEGPAEQVLESLDPAGEPGRAGTSPADGAIAAEIEEAGPTAAELSGPAATRVEEIVVTARRRAELLEDTPISVSVLSDQTLQDSGTTQLNQIQNLVPNLTIFRDSTGQSISIVTRGVGNFPFVYFDQGTPLYVDGVVLSRNAGSVLDIVDMAQIEVLRGPQGTLFGKNSVGGAVSITTVKPQPELDAYASIRAGSFNTFDSRAMLNLPVLDDQLFLRFNFASFQRDGYYTNLLNGDDLSDRNSQNVLLASRWQPTSDLTIDVTGSYTTSHTRELGGQCVVIEPAFSDQTPLVYTPETAEEYRRNCNRSGRFEGETDVSSLVSVESYGVWGVANYQVGPVGGLDDLGFKLTGAWRQQVVRSRRDRDGTAFPAFIEASTGGPGSDYNGNPTWQNQLQTELQVNGAAWDERIQFVAGAFAFWERARTDRGFRVFANTDSMALGPGTGDVVRSIAFSNNYITTNNNDWALFGQATANVTDWLSLTAGIRYTEETKRLRRILVNPEAPVVGQPAVAVDFNGKGTFDAWTPMASLALTAPPEWFGETPLEHVMGYFTYARGFRGGGFNGGARTSNPESIRPFKPEFIDSYEVGLKSISFEGRLTFNVALFYADRTDQQVPQAVTFEDPENGLVETDLLTRNTGESKTQGVEVEFLTQPIDGLRVDGSMGYLHGVFGDIPGSQNQRTGEPIDRDGEQYNFVPRWQTHLGVQYSLEVPTPGPAWLGGWLTPRVDWSFRSQTQYFAWELTELREPNRNIVNVRLSYDFNDNRSQVAFWGTNMTDHNYFQETIATPRTLGVVTRYWAQPRTMGVELTHRF